MRAAAIVLVAFYMTGCASLAERPVLRSALFAVAGAVVCGAVANESHGPAPAPPFPAPRPPAPFNPCSGSNLCAK